MQSPCEQPVRPLRTAIVGAGHMGTIHARVYSQLPTSKLVAIVDTDIHKARQLSDRYGCQAYDDYRRIVDQVDAVTIATPTPTHLEIAKAFVQRRIPVLIEKPIAATTRQARRIVKLSSQYRSLVAVGHSERYNPAILAIRPFVCEPRFIEAIRVSPFPFRSTEISVVLDLMIHDIDIVLSLVNKPLRNVQAIGVGVITDNQDLCGARLQFTDGCVASLTASRLALKKERKIRIFTPTAYLSVDCLNKTGQMIRIDANLDRIKWIRKQLAEGADVQPFEWTQYLHVESLQIKDSEPIFCEQQAFLDAILGRSGLPIVTAEDGLAALACAERITRTLAKQQWS